MSEDSFSAQHDLSIKQIMAELDDKDLIQYCVVNKRAATLCQNETFWRDRLIFKFGDYDFKFEERPKELSYKLLYKITIDIFETELLIKSNRNAKFYLRAFADALYPRIKDLKNLSAILTYICDILSESLDSSGSFSSAIIQNVKISIAIKFAVDGNDILAEEMIIEGRIDEPEIVGYMSDAVMIRYAKRIKEEYRLALKQHMEENDIQDVNDISYYDVDDNPSLQVAPFYIFKEYGFRWSNLKAFIFLIESEADKQISFGLCLWFGLYSTAHLLYGSYYINELKSKINDVFDDIYLPIKYYGAENLADNFIQFCLKFNLPVTYEAFRETTGAKLSDVTIFALEQKGIIPTAKQITYLSDSQRTLEFVHLRNLKQ
ncbi:MAG: hypothetical protein Solivirus4_5 [Solivirus sp.]|uniref:F-box domain-containing protein n=1 Tax=Solivirus sp. TaxID=2487772 RepID=A0A3G5AHI0_9VIRU|nr:MAG: hypothetical protein Solivirus4_5 [Solivirus sp.]